MNNDLNILAIGTLFKLESLLAAVAAGSAFADLIEYEDNQIDFVINHDHDKELIIKLIEGTIRNLNFMQSLASEGGKLETRLFNDDSYLMVINFKGDL